MPVHVVLTGAGFTKNWDGRLAAEFQQDLVTDPRVRHHPRLLELVRDQPSFEIAYGMTHKPPYDEAERAVLEAAIQDVFVRMDNNHSSIDRLNRINNTGVCKFISRFCPNPNRTGYFFTLNQDQLIERIFHPTPVTASDLSLPGIIHPQGEKTFGVWNSPISRRTVRFDPGSPPPLDACFNYIKLHGSFNWQAPGGQTSMVIGTGKEEQIAGNALLAWYIGVFERILNDGGVNLMTIGYGFGDEHINRIIASACRKSGLQLFVWNAHSKPLEVLKAKLGADTIPRVSEMPLSDVFPPDQSTPSELERIVRAFFGS
jgi:hypothetical protein